MDGRIPGAFRTCMEAIQNGRSVASVQDELFRSMPEPAPCGRPMVDVPDRDARRYSLARALLAKANNEELTGLEGEVSKECSRQMKREPSGFFVPNELLTRSLVAGTPTLGGHLVPTQLWSSDIITILKNRCFAAALGAKILPGLTANVTIPRQTASTTATWLPETGTVTASAVAVDQITLTPHAICSMSIYSKQLLMQSGETGGQIEDILRGDHWTNLAIAIDAAALAGAGGDEPTGIIGSAGTTLTVDAVPTFETVLQMEETLALANADSGNLSYLVNPEIRTVFKKTPVTTLAGSPMVWSPGPNGSGLLNMYRAEATNQLARNLTSGTLTTCTSSMIFGAWDQLYIAMFGASEWSVDPYTLATTRQLRCFSTNYADVALRQKSAFVVAQGCLAAAAE